MNHPLTFRAQSSGTISVGQPKGKNLRIFFPSHEKIVEGPMTRILDGIDMNPHIQLCDSEDLADLIFLSVDTNRLDRFNPKKRNFDKTVFLDLRDSTKLVPIHVKYYFKRSCLDTSKKIFKAYPRKVFHIAYPIRKEYFEHSQPPTLQDQRAIDISCFFDVDVNTLRGRVAKKIMDEHSWNKKHVGIVGMNKRVGRNTFQQQYFEIMKRSRIVVTCNPDRWEGDYRLYEAISSGALVLCDRLYLKQRHNFVDQQHLIFYDDIEDMVGKVQYYLQHEHERFSIAQAGYEFGITYHLPSSRIQEIVDTIFPDRLSGEN